MLGNVPPALASIGHPLAPPAPCPGFYLVESRWKRQTFIYETDLAKADRDAIVKDIATGEYDTGEITAVYRCDPPSRSMADETQGILEQVAHYLNRTETTPCEAVARLLWQNGIGYARH